MATNVDSRFRHLDSSQYEAVSSWRETCSERQCTIEPNLDGHLVCNATLVNAGPGSGKTTVIVNRVRWLIIKRRFPPESIAAMSFTREASAAVARKLRSVIGPAGGRVVTGSMHSICLSWLRERGVKILLDKKQCPDTDKAFAEAIVAHTFAELQNADARQAFQQKYHHILVDEVQDTHNELYTLLKMMFFHSTPVHAPPIRTLFVVGDRDQSIYSFSGAHPSLLAHFESQFPDVHVVYCTQNYRSTEAITALASAFIRGSPGAQLLPRCPPITFLTAGTQFLEATAVVKVISELRANKPSCSIAVLYRRNEQASLVETELRRNNILFTAATPVADLVTLSTIHKAKGLEYDVVFMIGLQGPIYAECFEEERRVCYVGMTRARTHLYLSCSFIQERTGPCCNEMATHIFLNELTRLAWSNVGRRHFRQSEDTQPLVGRWEPITCDSLERAASQDVVKRTSVLAVEAPPQATPQHRLSSQHGSPHDNAEQEPHSKRAKR